MKRKVIKKKMSNIEDEVGAEDDADIGNEEVQEEAAEEQNLQKMATESQNRDVSSWTKTGSR
jgi:hypothetical protein